MNLLESMHAQRASTLEASGTRWFMELLLVDEAATRGKLATLHIVYTYQ
jgi:hypothetical protein